MTKEVKKPPKSKQKITCKRTKNENNVVLDKQEKVKMSFNKKPTKEKTQIRSNQLKVSSLESKEKKFSKKSKIGENNDVLDKQAKDKKKQTVMKPFKVLKLDLVKKKTGDKKMKMEENTVNPSKVSSFLATEKKKIGDKKKKLENITLYSSKKFSSFVETEKKKLKEIKLSPSRVSNWGTEKKKIGDKKKFETDLAAEIEAKPKKKKRVIKIDPYDVSNKRLDDGNVLRDITNQNKKKVEVEEVETVELSMNAQFRAIKPSPSILTFVEDNLLGRRCDIELRKAGYNTELSAPLDNIPFSTSSERERIEESAFRSKLEFFAAAKVSTSFPPTGLPEIAFAGRSNVGKSSLLNALTRHWGVVRTSDKPGYTQSINFFKLGRKLNLVDLPGYGFAYAKEEVKEAWEELVKEYVSTRIGLKRVCLLIDPKWGLKPRDHELVHLMERSQTKYQIVLTKTDTVFPLDVARRAMQIEETFKEHKSVVQPVMMVSSKSGAGIRCLRTALAKIARFVKP